MGGTTITITGNYFDALPRVPTKVYVGGEPCHVIEGSLTYSEIKCTTPEAGEIRTFYPGMQHLTFYCACTFP